MIFNFNEPYNRENWIEFLRQHFLPQDYSHITEKVETEFKPKYISKNVLYLGHSKTLKLKVYEMYHDSENDPRIGLSRDAFKFIEHQKVKNALILFISQNSNNYRLSLITRELKLEGKKVTKEFTNPKRYSYLMGPDVKKHTIEEFLVKKGRIKDEEDLKSRFSVEIVNKEFYNNIAELFTELVGGVRKIGRQTKEFESLLKLPDTKDHTLMQEFAVRLIGRIVFCWFLKKKKSENGISLIPEEVLSVNAIKDNYYHTILEPLFFEVMNTPIDERKERFCHSERSRTAKSFPVKNGTQDDNDTNWSSIPFLNGGLFDPNLHQDYYKVDDFQNRSIYQNTLTIPDDWFIKLFSVLELYNFTIDENTSVDIDLSVDPEMLGRIFENLLAEINPETLATARKATGSYYTPRPIVEYMVDESLIQYLLTKLETFGTVENLPNGSNDNTDRCEESDDEKVDCYEGLQPFARSELEQKIRNLLDYTIEETELTKDESLKVIDALDKIKILDPACGSGAFPMGILQKMLLIRQKVDPESIEWVMKQLEMIPDILVRKAFEEKLMDENWDYKYKMSAILHSIYGVDIQTIAVELSKLRFFLTLMVDETVNDNKPNRGINELPNLSFKFVAANSLIGLGDENETILRNIKMKNKFNNIREQYFSASTSVQKKEIEIEFKSLQKELLEHLTEPEHKQTYIFADFTEKKTKKKPVDSYFFKLLQWNPFEDKKTGWFDPEWMFGVENGFDIVIGNPPYGVSIKGQYRDNVFNNLGKVPDYEIYYYFINIATCILKKNGIMSYIIPNTYLFNTFASTYRQELLNNWQILEILDCTKFRIFYAATVRNTINIFKKSNGVYVGYRDTKNVSSFKELINKERLQINNNELKLMNQNWSLAFSLDKKVIKVILKINSDSKPLKNFFPEISQGLIAYDKYRGQSKEVIEKRIYHYNYKAKDDLKPWLKGADVGRYGINWNQNKYIDYCDGIANPRESKYFNNARILVREITNPTIYAGYTNKELYNDPSIIIILSSKKSSIKNLLAILNSKLASFYHFNYSPKATKGDFPKILVKDIQEFPLKLFNISSIVDIIVDQILIDKKAGKDTQKLEDKIDLMVYKLYELSYEEVKIVDPAFALSKEEYEQDLS